MKLVTSNLAEVGRLISDHHKIIDITVSLGNMGAEEVVFTFEGENIDLDRNCFLASRGTSLKHVLKGLEAVQTLIWQKEEKEVCNG